ncbi:hypothetical protein CFIMG_001805RAa, partial [Ceratocystis fimbriata CBS 114723]
MCARASKRSGFKREAGLGDASQVFRSRRYYLGSTGPWGPSGPHSPDYVLHASYDTGRLCSAALSRPAKEKIMIKTNRKVINAVSVGQPESIAF